MRINLTVSNELYEKLELKAKNKNLPLATYVKMIISESNYIEPKQDFNKTENVNENKSVNNLTAIKNSKKKNRKKHK